MKATYLLTPLYLFSVLFHSQFLEAETFVGPVEFQNQYLASLGRILGVTRTSKLLSQGSLEYQGKYLLTNSVSRDRGLLVDGESRVLETNFRYGLTDSLELGIALPVLWRGVGQFDQAIDSWHSFFGFDEGDRDEVPRDNFSISGNFPNQADFNLTETGFGIGDLELSAKIELFSKDLNVSSRVSLQLPTGGELFGTAEPSLGLELLAGREWKVLAIDTGVGLFHYFDSQNQGIIFPKNNFSFFISAEYLIWRKLSFQVSGIIFTHPLRKVTGQHTFQSYVDTGFSWNMKKAGVVDFLVRENLNDGGNTADVTVLLGYRNEFNIHS